MGKELPARQNALSISLRRYIIATMSSHQIDSLAVRVIVHVHVTSSPIPLQAQGVEGESMPIHVLYGLLGVLGLLMEKM